ncbi:TonB-dependent receptor plug domain-containing protein [Qipengyuania sp. ASV99]|uniref:TonB-dependent receptor plug domain-containing protein n=1 Tax=Qipengyuania sp. ASV99 TaxID=3399681 RepID=UPI003A4C679A
MRIGLFTGSAALALAAGIAAPSLSAQQVQGTDGAQTEEGEDEIQTAREIVVQGDIGFRNRSPDAEPILIYDEEYFQRFEPLTAGDALKRVPSVTFLSDVIESDGARLRGLDPGYTQILINGERVPGGNADRSFFLDRIPAELIQQVEIVRSSSARRTGDAVAGSLNIVLRDGFSLDGGYVRGGGLLFDDGEFKPSGGFYYGGALAGGRVLIGANIQGRYNPKIKSSLRFGDSPENNPNFFADDFDNREDQTDTRDGTDYAFNASWGIESETTEFEILGNFVHTDRTESERSFEYDDLTAISGSVFLGGNLLTDNAEFTDIDQDTWSISARLEQEWSLGETTFRATFARFDGNENGTEFEIDFEDAEPVLEGENSLVDVVDDELSFQIDHEFEIADGIEFVIGGFLQFKERDSDLTVAEQEIDLDPALQSWDQFSDNPFDVAGQFDPFEDIPGGVNTISEDRTDLFALFDIERGDLTAEIGIRWENTSVDIEDATVPAALAFTSVDYDEFLPSASFKYELGRGRLTASVARTLRRPRLDFLSPVLLEEELEDSDFLGNPGLVPETAWGGDLGYEHKIGRTGVIGVNVFYRDITNLVELTTVIDPLTGMAVEGSEGPGTFVFQPQNVGSGEVYGIEFDASFSLAFIGLRDTGVFGNLALLDSNITDFAGERRFNDQSEYVYNFGAIQNLPEFGAAFGATYRKQGTAFGRVIAEEVTTSYGADLEIFVEKRIGDRFTIRAVGSNLLDSTKDEVFNKFDNVADQLARDFDEFEIESERAGPVFQLVARYAF